jgi:hypothetical protein
MLPFALAAVTLAALPSSATGVTAYGGHIVWSEQDAGAWVLREWYAGRTRRLPVRPRAVPFDADAGPDAHGRAVVVYSRCRVESLRWVERGQRCDVYRLALAGGAQQRVKAISSRGASETSPTQWGAAIVFARRPTGRAVGRVMLWSGGRTRRLPAGPSPAHDVTHVWGSDLDLGAGALTMLWHQQTTDPISGGDVQLRLIRRATRRTRVVDSGYWSGACGSRDVSSPTVTGIGVFFRIASYDCNRYHATLASVSVDRHARSSRALASVSQRAIKEVTRDGHLVVFLRRAHGRLLLMRALRPGFSSSRPLVGR